MTTTTTTQKVYAAISAVQGALARVGIAKDRKNTQGAGYRFRGIDDVYNALAPLLAEHRLCILPRMLSRTCEERVAKSGGALFYVTVHAEFDFVSAEDGSRHVVSTFGEAMDSSDKATNKAMSAAYKYAAFQSFSIPTEGDHDADAHTPEPIPAPTAKQQDAAAGLASEIALAPDEDALKKVAIRIGKAALPDALVADLRALYAARKVALTTPETPETETAP